MDNRKHSFGLFTYVGELVEPEVNRYLWSVYDKTIGGYVDCGIESDLDTAKVMAEDIALTLSNTRYELVIISGSLEWTKYHTTSWVENNKRYLE